MRDRVRQEAKGTETAPAAVGPTTGDHPLHTLQRSAGNRAVTALLRKSGGADPLGGTAVPGDIEARIGSSSGQPLDPGTRTSMESAFGADFSGVKIHSGAEAGTLSESLQAKAFTTGSDVFFGKGAYQPGSAAGQELLAHELTHVVQQQGGTASRSIRRFVDKKTFKDRTKQGALTGKSTAQKTIEKLLVKYAALDGPPIPAEQAGQAKALLTQMRGAADEWLAKHDGDKSRKKRGAGMAWFVMSTDAELDAIKAQEAKGSGGSSPSEQAPPEDDGYGVYTSVPATLEQAQQELPKGGYGAYAITNLADNEPYKVTEMFLGDENGPVTYGNKELDDDVDDDDDSVYDIYTPLELEAGLDHDDDLDDDVDDDDSVYDIYTPVDGEHDDDLDDDFDDDFDDDVDDDVDDGSTFTYGSKVVEDTSQGKGASAKDSKHSKAKKEATKYNDLKKVGDTYKHEFDQGSVVLAEVYKGLTNKGTSREDCKRIMLEKFGWTADDFEKNWDKAPTITDPLVDPTGKLSVTKVTEEDKANYQLNMGGTITQGPKNDVFDTTDSFSKFQGAGWAIFVMSPNGEFYAGSHKVGLFHHSSFLGGGQVAGAGELKVSGGNLAGITNKSGHYTPAAEQMIQVFEEIGPSKLAGKKYIHKYGPQGALTQEYEAKAFYDMFRNDPSKAPH